ncbi:MAG TPA: MmcQ/YjbR family DNA-binding protein [Baekduia sp.]|nr:MmcQ/YjbR family DNA-binding protein [Baekduia sp.]
MAIPDLRTLALSLPEAYEELTWGDHPTFRVRKKIFAILSADEKSVRLKADMATQKALIATDSDTYFVPSHVGRHGWIGAQIADVPQDELIELLAEAWRLAAPKKLVKAFDESAI